MGARIGLKLKILLSDGLAMVVYAITLAVFLLVFSNLNLHSEERSSIPIGLINYDTSAEAESVVEGILNTPAFYVYQGSMEELSAELLDGYINSIFVIEEGYGNKVRKGLSNELITVYSGEDDKTSVLLQDIFAGVMMSDIVWNKGYNRYKGLNGDYDRISEDEYRAYSNQLAGSDEFRFAFKTEYITGSSVSKEGLSNAILYRQIIAGMIAMLLAIIAFTAHNSTAREFEIGTVKRLKITGKSALFGLSDIVACIIYSLPADIVISVILCREKDSILKFIILNVIFSMICVILYWLAAVITKNIQHYQLLGAFLILVPGVCGFYSIFMGLITEIPVIRYLPNSVYIRFLADIIS